MDKVEEALAAAGVKAAQLKGSVHKKTAVLSAFQADEPADGDARVLLLNVADESASGANLTSANHAVFVHPLLAGSQQEYTACETQAIGRIRRYGQQKECTVWRFLVDNTIDTEISEARLGTEL